MFGLHLTSIKHNRVILKDEKYISSSKFKAENPDEIGFDKGVVLTVLEKKLDGWWRVQYQGKEGWAPGSYLKRLEVQEYTPTTVIPGIDVQAALTPVKPAEKPVEKPTAEQSTAVTAEVKLRNKLKVDEDSKHPPRRVQRELILHNIL